MCLVKYDINNVEIKKQRMLKTYEECNSYNVHSVRNVTLDHYSMIRLTVVINDKIASDTVILKRFR